MTVHPKRHFAKAITWRILATSATFIIAWLITGRVDFSLAIGGADVAIKIILYYFHERIWYRFRFGVSSDHNTSNR
jgi:uncharacterized membrane protein